MAISGAAAWRSFLESTPANTGVKIAGLCANLMTSVGARYWALQNPLINMHCEKDGGPRRFKPASPEVVLRDLMQYAFITYACRDCGTVSKTFAILVVRQAEGADAEVMKLGEYPPFAAPISRRIEKLLTAEDLALYRKGTRAEAHGLGIGAATYFRRIVESQWKLLVSEIKEAAIKLGRKDTAIYDKALSETQFSSAVELLKDALPEKLLILEGENPLTLLYRPLSKGLHELSDEDCLQQAVDIRTVLTALLENIALVLKDQDGLRGAASRLKGA